MLIKLIKMIIIATVIVMVGCTSYRPHPNDPDFAPVMPEQKPKLTPDMGSIYFPQQGLSLYEDIKAHNVGDLITVMLMEKTDASKNINNKYQKQTTDTLPEPSIFGTANAQWKFPKQLPIPLTTTDNLGLGAEIEGNVQFNGTADSYQKNKLIGTVTVVVTKIFSNGNLYVKGEKWVGINEGDEYIRLSGIVRPDDINPDNTIDSNRIADARIAYSGRGGFANSNKPGWLTQILTHPWWPI